MTKLTAQEFRNLVDHGDPPCCCGNCTWTGPESATGGIAGIENLSQRIGPGEVCPAGQCPSCGSLVHLDMSDVLLGLALAPDEGSGGARDMSYDPETRRIIDENGLKVAADVVPQDAALLLGHRLTTPAVAEIIADMLAWNAEAFEAEDAGPPTVAVKLAGGGVLYNPPEESPEVNGADLVDAFSEWRARLVAALVAQPAPTMGTPLQPTSFYEAEAARVPQVVVSTGITVTTKPSPRLLLVINGGMVETIAAEGIDFPVQFVQIDYDTDGDEDGVTKLDGTDCYLEVSTVDAMSLEDSALASLAVKEWEIA